MGARDDPLWGHEAPEGARRSRSRHHTQRRAREIAFSERRTDSPNPRQMDRQIQGTPGLGTRRSKEFTGEKKMDPGKKDSVTYVHQIYIRAAQQAIWDAITSPEWNAKYGYQAVSEYDLKPG